MSLLSTGDVTSLSRGMVGVFKLDQKEIETIKQGFTRFSANPEVQKNLQECRGALDSIIHIGVRMDEIEEQNRQIKTQEAEARDSLRVAQESRQTLEVRREAEQGQFEERRGQLSDQMQEVQRELQQSAVIALGANPLASRTIRTAVRIGQYAGGAAAPIMAYAQRSALAESCTSANGGILSCVATALDPWMMVVPVVSAIGIGALCTKFTEMVVHIEQQEERMQALQQELDQAAAAHQTRLDALKGELGEVNKRDQEATEALENAATGRQELEGREEQLTGEIADIQLQAHAAVIHDQTKMLEFGLQHNVELIGVGTINSILKTVVAQCAGSVASGRMAIQEEKKATSSFAAIQR